MLLRILADNPGPRFTRYIDDKFVDKTKLLLRQSSDPSVQQLLRETLQAFDREKSNDNSLERLLVMWRKVRQAPMPNVGPRGPPPRAVQGYGQQPRHNSSNDRPRNTLPSPVELAGRVEEARTSAKLLIQLTQSTPPSEFDSNDLIREFAERCQSAQRSLQGYMNCDDPVPDEATLQTLIEACEQLSLASSKHQRAKLAATRSRNSAVRRAEELYSNNGQRNSASGASTSPNPPWQTQRSPQLQLDSQPLPQSLQAPLVPQQSIKSPPQQGQYANPATETSSSSATASSSQHVPSTFSPFFSPDAVTASNPFSDEHKIAPQGNASTGMTQQSRNPVPSSLSSTNRFYAINHMTSPPPRPGAVEMPDSSSPAALSSELEGQGQFDSSPVTDAKSSLDSPSAGGHAYNDDDDDDDLYAPSPQRGDQAAANSSNTINTNGNIVSPNTVSSPPPSSSVYSSVKKSPPPSFPPHPSSLNGVRDHHDSDDDLYGADDSPVENHRGRGLADLSLAPITSGGRIKDDDPMTPVAGVSGSGWRY